MLENNYNNALKQNNGYHILGPGPIDDRTVAKDVNSLFISTENKKACHLYNRAYDGMQISVFESDNTISLYQLLDSTPYKPGGTVNVNASNFKEYWTILNTKQISEDIKKAQFFQGGDLDDELAILTDHGNLPKGLKVSDLESMTISEILRKIIFETAKPKKTVDQSCSVSFKSPYNGIVEVGYELPTENVFGYAYTPEKWNWVSKNDATVFGEEKSLSAFDEITYYYNTTNSNEGGNPVYNGYSTSVVEGTNGYWYGKIDYMQKDDAIDSLGKNVDENDVKYAEAKEGSVSTPTITFTGAWKIYSNATMISASSLWSHRNDNINANNYKGKDAKENSNIFCEKAKNVYMLFPKQTTDAQPFYIYVPASYKVTAIASANNAVQDVYDIEKTVGGATDVTIQCTYASGSYKRYTIEKSAGNTCVKVTIAKA